MKRMSLLVVCLAVRSLMADVPPLLNGQVRGVITDVKGPTITIMHSVDVDTGNARVTRRGNARSVSELRPGTRVTIAIATVKANKPGVLVADTITIDPSEATLSGPLEAASTQSVTVLGQQIRLAEDTFYGGFVDGKALQSPSALKLGYPVDVEIVTSADGPLAFSVTAIGPSPRAPQPPPVNHASVTGVIASINDNVWMVGGTRVFVVDKKTVVTGSPAVGDRIEAEGLKTPDGAIIANTVSKR